MELAKKNVLTLAIAQGLSITSTGINIIHTGLVGVLLAPKPEYATIPLSFQFITVALTLIPISLLMGKFGRKIIFFLGVLSCFIGSLLVVFAIFENCPAKKKGKPIFFSQGGLPGAFFDVF